MAHGIKEMMSWFFEKMNTTDKPCQVNKKNEQNGNNKTRN